MADHQLEVADHQLEVADHQLEVNVLDHLEEEVADHLVLVVADHLVLVVADHLPDLLALVVADLLLEQDSHQADLQPVEVGSHLEEADNLVALPPQPQLQSSFRQQNTTENHIFRIIVHYEDGPKERVGRGGGAHLCGPPHTA